MDDRLLTVEQVMDRTTLSESEIRRRMAESQFPKPIKLSAKRVAWIPSEVTAWVQDQIKRERGND